MEDLVRDLEGLVRMLCCYFIWGWGWGEKRVSYW